MDFVHDVFVFISDWSQFGDSIPEIEVEENKRSNNEIFNRIQKSTKSG